jgi:hypothetical protein
LGIKGGVNFSNFTGGDFEDLDNNTMVGFHAGGFVNFKFGNNLSLQPEVMISTQGAKLEDDISDEDYKITYVVVPVMLKYRFNGGFYLEAGPQFGFKVDENVPEQQVEDFAKGTDIGAAAGLGFHSKMGLGIGARYIAGISKVGDFDASNIDPDFRNSVIQVSIFYTLFNKGNK